MRFPRSAKAFRGQIDTAPLAGVFFLLVIFMLLASLVYTPGVPVNIASSPITPPSLQSSSSTDGPTVVVAVNNAGNFFFENQLINEEQLQARLAASAMRSRAPLTLIILADKETKYDVVIRLTQLAGNAGIKNVLLQGQPIKVRTLR